MYFLHGRVWYNDPDPVYVRPTLPVEHARLICSWVAISGQLNISSEDYSALPADRLDILRRSMPAHHLLARPIDLFENDPPRLWVLSDERRRPRRDILALYNWDTAKSVDFDYSLGSLGLDADRSYRAFDYWDDTLLPPMKGRLRLSVPRQSCRILAVRPALERPQVISTSRHVTQGMVDLLEEKWDATTATLSGRSRVVGGDSYELRIVADASDQQWRVAGFDVASADKDAGVRTTVKPADGLVRARLESSVSREVSWSLRFQRAPRK
jgi:hypothetical protein